MQEVSVIIPCYNDGEFLDDAVHSALQQTYRNIEIVIVDDGSTDQFTLSLLAKSKWERTRIIRQENRGVSAARNAGISAAKGEFILPLDADDLIDPTYVEKALTVFARKPKAGIVYCRAQRFGLENREWDLPKFNLGAMLLGNIIFCTAFYRKSDWERVGGYCEDLVAYGDYDLWLKLISLGVDVHQIDELLFQYRIKESSMTTTFLTDEKTQISEHARIFQNNKDLYARHAEFLFRRRFDFVFYHQIDDLERKAPVTKLKKVLRSYPRLEKLVRALLGKQKKSIRFL